MVAGRGAGDAHCARARGRASGSTPPDDWFLAAGEAHPELGRVLLVFTDGRVVFALWCDPAGDRARPASPAAHGGCGGGAIRRDRGGAAGSSGPFGREKDGALAYPSGHTTLTVVVLGHGRAGGRGCGVGRRGAVTAAALGVLGQGLTYHYFTDTVGAVFLGTALVCLARTGPPDLTGVNPVRSGSQRVVSMASMTAMSEVELPNRSRHRHDPQPRDRGRCRQGALDRSRRRAAHRRRPARPRRSGRPAARRAARRCWPVTRCGSASIATRSNRC